MSVWHSDYLNEVMMYSDLYFNEVVEIATSLDKNKVEKLAKEIADIRNHAGRVFVLGVGGSAGNASHMVNDLRKLCGCEAYAPTDNVPELTARTNDEGFDTIFTEYLRVSHFCSRDAIFVLSVGGGNKEKNVSVGIVKAIDLAKEYGAKVLGIVGKSDGYAAKMGDTVVVVPAPSPDRVTPHSEAFQAVVWHSLVSNPVLQKNSTKW
jgi:D-sedoheptulose 7-phosphate isomerase